MALRVPLIAILAFSVLVIGDCYATRSLSSTKVRSLSKLVRGSTSDTIRALDTDGNGRVSLSEIEAFARKNGIAMEEIRADFSDLDQNQDGELDSKEISGLFPASPDNDAVADAKDTTVTAAADTDAGSGSPTAVFEALKSPAAVAPAKLTEASQASVSAEGTTLGIEDIERNAQRQAGGVLAGGLAKRAEELMTMGAKDEKSALTFETQARSLRGRSAAATRSIALEAKQAAKTAAAAAAEKGLAEVRKLTHQAEQLEKRAAEHRSRATVALHEALKVQDDLSHSGFAPDLEHRSRTTLA